MPRGESAAEQSRRRSRREGGEKKVRVLARELAQKGLLRGSAASLLTETGWASNVCGCRLRFVLTTCRIEIVLSFLLVLRKPPKLVFPYPLPDRTV